MSSPPKLTPQYLNANKGPQVIAIIVIFPSLAFIVVALRLFTRFRIVHNPSYEDFAILVAWVFSVATSICQGYQVMNGMGRHVQAITLAQTIGSLKALFASIIMYNFSLTLIKFSIAQQYLRITIDPPVRKACWAFMLFTLLNCIQTFFTGIFSCYPVAKFWDDRIPGGCVNKSDLWYANAAINIVQDIWILVLPIFILRKLVLPRREKISLCVILGLGGFASLASILRLHALYLVAISKDITWDNPGTATWSAMELNIGIICASLPTLRAFIGKYFPGTFHFHHSHDQSGNRGLFEPSARDETIATVQTQAGEVAEITKKEGVEGSSEVERVEDIEKAPARPTFLASDSEAESGVLRPEMMQLRSYTDEENALPR